MTRCLTGGKIIYPNQQKALEVAERAEIARGAPLRAYYCGACGGYHLTKRATMLEEREGIIPHSSGGAPSRGKRRSRAEQLCAERLPREEEELKAMLAEVELLRGQIHQDLKVVAATSEEDLVRNILGELRTRRNALRFVMKKSSVDRALNDS